MTRASYSPLTRADRARPGEDAAGDCGRARERTVRQSRSCRRRRPGLRVVLRGLSVKQIGRLLARAEGIAIDGFMVRKLGTDMHVTQWHVVACFITVSNPAPSGVSGLIRVRRT